MVPLHTGKLSILLIVSVTEQPGLSAVWLKTLQKISLRLGQNAICKNYFKINIK